MKKIIRIARVEVLNLFYMPVAWLILIAFMIQTGIEFFLVMRRIERPQSMGFTQVAISSQIFFGLFYYMKSKVLYYIPLLSMGLISRELSSGSIKLVYSSPVKIGEFIIGKFLGIAWFSLSFILILLIYIGITFFTVENADWAAAFSGLLGIYLLICTYIAVGVFMSSLTIYQAVAAIATLVVLFSLNNLGKIWQQYDFFRDLTYNLSLEGRVDNFVNGLVTTREVIYFLLMTATFLTLSVMRLTYHRKLTRFLYQLPGYTLLVVVVVAIGYISSRPKLIGYWDATHTQSQTLSKTGQDILKKIKEPMEVTTYVNLLDGHYPLYAPQSRNSDWKLLEKYQRFHRSLKINYEYYYGYTPGSWRIDENPGMSLRDIAMKVAKTENKPISYFKTPEEIAKEVDLSLEQNRIVRTFRLNGKQANVNGYFFDMEQTPREREMFVPIKLISGSVKQKLGFVTGHNETEFDAPRGFRVVTLDPQIRESLCHHGFTSQAVSLKEEIPSDLAALVITNPKFDFSADEKARLQHYVAEGGNLLIFGEIRKKEVMDKLFEPFGFRFMDITLLGGEKRLDQDVIRSVLTRLPDDDTSRPNPKADIGFLMPRGGGAFEQISDAGFKIEYVGVIDTAVAWYRPGRFELIDSARLRFHPEYGDAKKPLPTAVKLTRKINNKDQKIMLLGDADILVEALNYGEFGMLHSIMRWVSKGEFPIKISSIPSIDNKLHLDKQDILLLRKICFGVIPAIIFVSGTVLLIKRKRK